jgi:protein-L-isoaspartate(D-aspartate) O-methyltransferase
MFDFAAARRMMVDSQVRPSDVTDQRIIAAMSELPRERFVPERNASLAYLDCDVAVTEGPPPRRLMKPMVLAKLVQAADIGPEDRVLDVGCATGYATAVLTRLAASVVALEEDGTLARLTRENLAHVNAKADVVTGTLPDGWQARAPYNVILIDGAVERVPDAMFRQLSPGGRLMAIVGQGPAPKAMRYLATGNGRASGVPLFDASAALLPGFAEPPVFVF